MCAIELLYWFSNIRYWSPAMGVASSKLSTENSIIGTYMFLRKFHQIEMKADLDVDEIWRSVWLGLFIKHKYLFLKNKIFIHQAYLNSKALIGSFRHDGCPGSKAWLRTHPRRCTSCWPNTCHTLSIQITSTSLLL